MNRRDLLKALIASPIAAAAGSSLLKAAPMPAVPVALVLIKPTSDYTVFKSLFGPSTCSYSTTRPYAPEIGSEVSVERNGEVVFVGVVDRINENGLVVDVHATADDFTEEQRRDIYEEYGVPHCISAVNFPAD